MALPPLPVLTVDQVAELLRWVPSWHACVLGPVPFGKIERVHLVVNCILVETRDEAVEALWRRVREACEIWKREFDEDDWEVLHCAIVNGN